MSSSSFIAAIVLASYNIASLLPYCINGLSDRNRPMNINKLRRFFLFNPDNILMKTLKATTQIGGFSQHLPMRQYNKQFPYSGTRRNKDDAIDTFFSSLRAYDGTNNVEIIVGTKTLLTDVYAIESKSGINIAKVIQDHFCETWNNNNNMVDNSQD